MLIYLQPVILSENSNVLYCLVIITLLVIGGGVFLKFSMDQFDKERAIVDKKIQAYNPIFKFHIGKYLTGLRSLVSSEDTLTCAVLQDDFVFFDSNGSEIDRIKRDSINQIIVDDKSQITQRITVGRILALGIFSLAAPKTEKREDFCILIDWDDEKGIRQNTIFEYQGEQSNEFANLAAGFLKKFIKPKVQRLQDSEKKCPYCAEIIKAEAVVCRFCGRDLT